MATPLCPLLGKACAEARCMFWVFEEFTDTRTGARKAEHGCQFRFQYELQRQAVVEQVRTQASVDKMATATAQGFGGVAQAIEVAAARRALAAGGGE